MPGKEKWTTEEVECLQTAFQGNNNMTPLEIQERLLPHRSVSSIASKASRMRVFMRAMDAATAATTTTVAVGGKRKRRGEVSDDKTPRKATKQTNSPTKKANKSAPKQTKTKSPTATNKKKPSSSRTPAKAQPTNVASSKAGGTGSLGARRSISKNVTIRSVETNKPLKGISKPVVTDVTTIDKSAQVNQGEVDVKDAKVESLTWKDWLQDPETTLNMKALGMGCFLVFCLRYVVPQLEKAVFVIW